LLDHFASDTGARNRGAAVRNFFAVRVHEHVAKSKLPARIALEQIDVDRITFRDAILPPACFDNWEKSQTVTRTCLFDKRKSPLWSGETPSSFGGAGLDRVWCRSMLASGSTESCLSLS
jgi:hypothetical protein